MNPGSLPRLFVFLSLCLPFAGIAADAASKKVPRWDRFETSVTNAKTYTDPYRDVSLDATFTRPDGRTVTFWGFHDGDQTWRLRFMPDLPGTWRYEAKFSDGTPGASGTFECVASDLPGMIAVHAANPTWFGYRGTGEATTLRALHIGDRFFARNWDDADNSTDGNKRTAFLDWAKQQGYNTLSVASHYQNRRAAGRGDGWETPALWPLKAEEYRRMEKILDDLAARQLIVYPFAGFFGRDSYFPHDRTERTLYIRYLTARLAPYWNLLFNVGGPEPRLRNKDYLSTDEINLMGLEIAASDPFGHALSLHNQTGDDEFKDAAWLTYGTLQGPKTLDRRKLAAGLLKNHHFQKPLLAQETLWSGNMYHIRSNKADYSDADIRKNAYVIHFCGANLVYADNDGDSSSGFTGTLEPAARKQVRHDILKRVWDTFASLPFAATKPAPALAASTDTAAFCLADPGRTYLVYLETPGTVNVRVTDGPYKVEWINATNPSDRRPAGETRDGQNLASPREADDWILVLRR